MSDVERALLVQREHEQALCVHYGRRGLDVLCARGVDARALVGERPGWGLRLPCRAPPALGGLPVADREVVPCELYEREAMPAIEARVDAVLRGVASFLAGRSPCCDAPIEPVGLVRCPTCGQAVGRVCQR